jgi:hypothetical protein
VEGDVVEGATVVVDSELPAVDEAVEAAVDEAVDVWLVDAHTVASPGVVVKAVTVKSGVPPFVHVQHGSPKAAPFVMSEPGNVSIQKSAVHE